MNTYIEPAETYLDGEVSLVHINQLPEDHEELLGFVDEMDITLSSLFPNIRKDLPDLALMRHPTIKHNQTEDARDPVSVEFVYHFDGACEPGDLRPRATLAVAREAGQDAPATQFVSTSRFLELVKASGVFDTFDPKQVESIFGYSAYYRQFQSQLLELEPTNPRLQEVVANDLTRFGASTREELFEILDDDPIKGTRPLPLIDSHSITGEDWLTIDGGARNIKFRPKNTPEGQEIDQRDLDEAFAWIRLLLADTDLLRNEGIIAEVTPRTGFAVAFSREGLHRQMVANTNQAQKAKRQMSIIGLVNKTI